MTPYANRGGDSNVAYYDIGSDFIEVQFNDGSVYRYTYASTGRADVERMKELARAGRGLNGFINTHVGRRYESRRR